jgi:hypothetical protein
MIERFVRLDALGSLLTYLEASHGWGGGPLLDQELREEIFNENSAPEGRALSAQLVAELWPAQSDQLTEEFILATTRSALLTAAILQQLAQRPDRAAKTLLTRRLAPQSKSVRRRLLASRAQRVGGLRALGRALKAGPVEDTLADNRDIRFWPLFIEPAPQAVKSRAFRLDLVSSFASRMPDRANTLSARFLITRDSELSLNRRFLLSSRKVLSRVLADRRSYSTWARRTQPLWPPRPMAFERATSIWAFRALFGT